MDSSSDSNLTSAPLTKIDKIKIRQADPNNGRCLITNGYALNSVQFCHCVPKKFMRDPLMLDKLEWAWNMKRFTLNLNSCYNYFSAESSYHITFDHDEWLLMPEVHVIEKYFKSLSNHGGRYFVNRKSFPEFPEQDIYRYKLVPLQQMEQVIFLRRNSDYIQEDGPDIFLHHDYDYIQEDGPDISHFSLHFYPFNTLPVLESHLHPKFVIFNAGAKLDSLDEILFKKVLDTFPGHAVEMIWKLYGAWTKNVPRLALIKKDLSYWLPDDFVVMNINEVEDVDDADKDDAGNDSDYGTIKTKSGRGWPWVSPQQQEARPAKRKWQQVLGSFTMHNRPSLLSEVTLSSFNRQMGEATWTDHRIREWSKPSKRKRKHRHFV